MALAGQREVVVAIEADLARTAGHARGERGDRRPGAGLALLAAEAAAHAPRLDGDERVRYSEDAGDDVLRLGRILRRSVHRHLVAFAGKGERRLALEIEMLLPADRELALKPMRRLADRGGGVAAPEGIVVLHPLAADERVGDRDRRRLRLDVDPGEPRRPARLVARASDDGEQRLAVEHDLVGRRTSGSSANTGAISFLPGISAAVRTATTPGAARTALQVQALQFARGLVGHADRDMQRARGLADVVDIVRRALDVQNGGIMRQRLMNDRGRKGDVGYIIRRHGAFRSASAHSRRRSPAAPFREGWRRPSCDRRRSRAGR